MEKVQGLAEAITRFVVGYCEENNLGNQEAMNAMAHAYVIFGFVVKKDDASDDVMRDALIGCVTASADHMMQVRNEEA